MKNNTITVVYHSGKEDLKELMIKLVKVKITSQQKLIKNYNYNSYKATIKNEEQA
ncbi:MAG: hypothetical protein H7Y18_12160 [Clostridiaceae bacterium]|nr:hypothetical protein [Clostridiaceae bacterium]